MRNGSLKDRDSSDTVDVAAVWPASARVAPLPISDFTHESAPAACDSGTSLMAFGSSRMPNDERTRAMAEFKRAILWVIVAAVVMVIGAIVYLALTGDLTTHMVVATIIGAFLSVLLGGGLMAASFFSDKSGHDQSINDATSRRDEER